MLFSKEFLADSVFTKRILEVKGTDLEERMGNHFQITKSNLESIQNYGCRLGKACPRGTTSSLPNEIIIAKAFIRKMMSPHNHFGSKVQLY